MCKPDTKLASLGGSGAGKGREEGKERVLTFGWMLRDGQGIMSCTLAKAGANAAADLAGESRRSGVTTACKQGLDLREE